MIRAPGRARHARAFDVWPTPFAAPERRELTIGPGSHPPMGAPDDAPFCGLTRINEA